MIKQRTIFFSIIVPVFNRPKELDELLASLDKQTDKEFEVIVVEDGSEVSSKPMVSEYEKSLDIRYYYKENSGPGLSRNYGSERAKGNYFVFLDSDCILPPEYIRIVKSGLNSHYVDAFGGPDRAHKDFSGFQKAISYSMTSFFTTGGIRGGSEKLDKFYPRSFNMGYSGTVFEATGGFSGMRFGEDIDMSIRILNSGFRTKLIKEAYVYHKRRTNLHQFFKQVYNSGIARINLYKRHPLSLKPVHFAPSLFTLGCIFLLLLSIIVSPFFLIPLLVHAVLILFDSAFRNRNFYIGWISVLTSYIQLLGYGTGFLTAIWKRMVLRKDEYSAFNKNFYK